MSITDFAEHPGAARRTVAKWSSRGRDVQLRTEMQSALDTVLARASTEARERFGRLRSEGTGGAPAVPSDVLNYSEIVSIVDDGDDCAQDGDVRRRDFLANTAAGGVGAVPAVAVLLDALLSTRGAVTLDPPLSMRRLTVQVAAAKRDYQACRYERLRERLVTLLPAFAATRSQLRGAERCRIDVLAADLYHVVGSVLLKSGDQAMDLVAAERSTQSGLDSGDPVAVGTSARIMTHALMSNGRSRQAVALAEAAAVEMANATRLDCADSVAVYGALLLRGAVAAARCEDRDRASTMLDEAATVATRLGQDGNDRWTAFGPNNVLQHRVISQPGPWGTREARSSSSPMPRESVGECRPPPYLHVRGRAGCRSQPVDHHRS